MGIFSLFNKSNTVFFPGCTLYFKYRESFNLYQKIFNKLGIGFRIIDKKICCGIEPLEAGYETEARKLARRNFEIFKEVIQMMNNREHLTKEGLDKIAKLISEMNRKPKLKFLESSETIRQT